LPKTVPADGGEDVENRKNRQQIAILLFGAEQAEGEQEKNEIPEQVSGCAGERVCR